MVQGLLMVTTMTREQWLNDAVEHLQRLVFTPAALELPHDVKVSCSWPGGGSARKRIGECWTRAASAAGVNEVFISPNLDNASQVLDVLAHELIHAIDDCKSGHGKAFGKMARRIGLEGKLTATHAGVALTAQLNDVLALCGQYPHRMLSLAGRKKQDTRMIKFLCNDCPMNFRASAKHMVSVCMCPACGGEDYTIGG